MSGFETLLRTYRLRRGWTQAELGRRCRLSRPSISRMESGGRLPLSPTVTRLANALGLSAVERDRLLLAAGYAPVGSSSGAVVVYHRRDEPQLHRLGLLLAGDDLTPDERHELRAELEQVLKRHDAGRRTVRVVAA